jgi:DNA polymerase
VPQEPAVGRGASPAERPAERPAARRPAPAAAASTPAPGTVEHDTRRIARAAPDLATLAREVAECRACGLCLGRTQTVFADGNPAARVMFVGEGPGAEEDRTGVPFVGDAGQLLTKIITGGMGLDRSRDVYIANVVKCRPPGNRDPAPDEKAACTPFLERQIELVDPAVIVTLGRHAAGHLLESDAPISRLRGQVVRKGGRAIVPTFHPAYLLRSPEKKKECWADIQLAMAELGLEPPKR